MIGRWPYLLFAGLLVASLLSVGVLERKVFADLQALATAQNDDVSWTMSQLEVELMGLQNAILDARAEATGEFSTVRKRFDIFFSRITTFRQSAFFKSLSSDEDTVKRLAIVVDFLDVTAPVIDADDGLLEAALPDLNIAVVELRTVVRGLALAGVEVFSQQEAERRATLSGTLKRSAYGLVLLICLLMFAVGILITLFRQGLRVSQMSEVARARYEAAIASSLDAVLVVDTNGRIMEFNGAAEAVFGYSREEALGADMSELVVPARLRALHRDGMRRFLKTGEAHVIGKGRLRLEGLRKSGEVFPVELSISLSDASGERVFVSFLRDITSELIAEEELRSALTKAQDSERAKSDLLTVMSHEMRTPLNGILGSLDVLEKDGLSEKQAQHLNAISVSGELLLSHVNDVLELSSISAQALDEKRDVFDLKALVQSTLDSLQGHAEARNNKLTVEFLTPDLTWVTGNQTSFQRCLVNLVGNALKFTEDGIVSVDVERLDNSEVVEVRIADTGVGIAPENLGRIFEEFVTVDTAYDRTNSGTGLGLAITKGLLEGMRGFIEVESELNEGSLITVRVPLPPVAQREATPVSGFGEQSLPSLPAGFRCLVVDDNKINRDVLTAILTELGGVVTEASDGFQAIDLAAETAFEVMFLDISMPEIDGIETLARIRTRSGASQNATAMAVTAHAAPADHAKIRSESFTDVLIKPLNKAVIHQSLAALWGIDVVDDFVGESEKKIPEFLQQFGMEKFQAALDEALIEIEDLLSSISESSYISEKVREEAHRLSGSAAILGLEPLWVALQELQNFPDDAWGEGQSTLISNIQAEVDHARKTWA
ncbi:response regulator [Shimia sp. NS0008-38b]|uniref:hybrid sensor histidine kinase/response regulator n=1 Tax=Shimia sp. NS0008-38b TaxID=3127653 RepID=UPI00310363E0